MIENITRGAIIVQAGERRATLPGEMFAPANSTMGFEIWRSNIRHWDAPHQNQPITPAEQEALLAEVAQEFERMGYVLELA